MNLRTYSGTAELSRYKQMKLAYYTLTPPLPALWQCQSQAWIKEEGDANGRCYSTT